MPPPSLGANQPVSVSRLQMQLHLQGLQQSTNALRKQLSQLRNMQVGEKRVYSHPENPAGGSDVTHSDGVKVQGGIYLYKDLFWSWTGFYPHSLTMLVVESLVFSPSVH